MSKKVGETSLWLVVGFAKPLLGDEEVWTPKRGGNGFDVFGGEFFSPLETLKRGIVAHESLTRASTWARYVSANAPSPDGQNDPMALLDLIREQSRTKAPGGRRFRNRISGAKVSCRCMMRGQVRLAQKASVLDAASISRSGGFRGCLSEEARGFP